MISYGAADAYVITECAFAAPFAADKIFILLIISHIVTHLREASHALASSFFAVVVVSQRKWFLENSVNKDVGHNHTIWKQNI